MKFLREKAYYASTVATKSIIKLRNGHMIGINEVMKSPTNFLTVDTSSNQR